MLRGAQLKCSGVWDRGDRGGLEGFYSRKGFISLVLRRVGDRGT